MKEFLVILSKLTRLQDLFEGFAVNWEEPGLLVQTIMGWLPLNHWQNVMACCLCVPAVVVGGNYTCKVICSPVTRVNQDVL